MSDLKSCVLANTPRKVNIYYTTLHHSFISLGRIRIGDIKPEPLLQRKILNTFDITKIVVLFEKILTSWVWTLCVCSTKGVMQWPLGLVRYKVLR